MGKSQSANRAKDGKSQAVIWFSLPPFKYLRDLCGYLPPRVDPVVRELELEPARSDLSEPER